MKPTRYEENQATYADDSHRRPAQKAERKNVKHGRRLPPPAPSPKLNKTKDLESLLSELQAKAAEFHKLAEQARAADWDRLNGGGEDRRTDEVNYGVLETFARNVAGRLKRNLEL